MFPTDGIGWGLCKNLSRKLKEDEMKLKEQLRDVVITISEVELDDDGNTYAVTKVYRYDLADKVKDFVTYLEGCKQLVEGGVMKNEQ